MSMWSLQWNFTNKSVTGASRVTYWLSWERSSIKSYSLVTQLDTMVKSQQPKSMLNKGTQLTKSYIHSKLTFRTSQLPVRCLKRCVVVPLCQKKRKHFSTQLKTDESWIDAMLNKPMPPEMRSKSSREKIDWWLRIISVTTRRNTAWTLLQQTTIIESDIRYIEQWPCQWL